MRRRHSTRPKRPRRPPLADPDLPENRHANSRHAAWESGFTPWVLASAGWAFMTWRMFAAADALADLDRVLGGPGDSNDFHAYGVLCLIGLLSSLAMAAKTRRSTHDA